MKKKSRLSTEEIIKRLRNPQAFAKPGSAQTNLNAAQEQVQKSKPEETVLGGVVRKRDLPLAIIGGSCLILLFITLLFYLMAKNRAEDLVAALDPGQVEGLKVDENEFNPDTGVTYIQVKEGQDRNVTAANLGTTLPIISRFNLKTFTDTNYKLVGAAPWALTTNFASNYTDPTLMRMLLDNDTMIQAFLAREDVAPLLDDPQMLLAFAKDEKEMADFFGSDVVQKVLANEQLLRTTAGSRFMGYLLISRAGKYFRANPQEAVAVIENSPTLLSLRSNPAVRKAVEENPKLGKLAPLLLGPDKPVVATEKKAAATPKADKKTSRKKK